MKSFWDHFEHMRVTLGAFRCDLGVTLGLTRHMKVILGTLGAHFGHTRVTLGVRWSHFGVNFGMRGDFGCHFGQLWGHL